MLKAGFDSRIRIMGDDRVCDFLVIGKQFRNALFLFDTKHAQPVNLCLFFKNDLKCVINTRDAAQNLMKRIIKLAEPFDILRCCRSLLFGQCSAQQGFALCVATRGRAAYHLFFDRRTDKACLFDLAH